MRLPLHITYIGHATCLIETAGVRLLTDPVLRDRVGHIRRQNAGVDPESSLDIDTVLVSHAHLDHLDLPSLRRLGRDTRIIVPAGSGNLLRRNGFRRVEEIRSGDHTRVGPVIVEATPAAHAGQRHPFGPVSAPVGYVVHGERTVYFAGDTDLFPEMNSIHESLDAALLPVWGWGPTLGVGHMCPRRAAESLRMLNPRTAIPIHWGTFAPLGMGWMRPRFLFDPPYDFAAHAGAIAPHVDVHVVHPGHRFASVN
jgi:L-ascorbate metabolism protein UlaG (beta-lactamase superfamily)